MGGKPRSSQEPSLTLFLRMTPGSHQRTICRAMDQIRVSCIQNELLLFSTEGKFATLVQETITITICTLSWFEISWGPSWPSVDHCSSRTSTRINPKLRDNRIQYFSFFSSPFLPPSLKQFCACLHWGSCSFSCNAHKQQSCHDDPCFIQRH